VFKLKKEDRPKVEGVRQKVEKRANERRWECSCDRSESKHIANLIFINKLICKVTIAERRRFYKICTGLVFLLLPVFIYAQTTTPDYSNLDNWAAHPWKHDAADSVPEPLLKDFVADSTADVFFIHPTTYLDKNQPFGWNAPVDDIELNKKTDNTTILKQGSIFNIAGRVFAPRYRQAHIDAYYTTDTVTARAALDEAYSDVKAAFEYYMAHYNKGRPVIIASHSQGTTHAKRLLKEFFDGKPLQQKLIAAYIVGIAVEPNWFTHLQPCTTPAQTGCFCTWRTLETGYLTPFVQNEKFTAVVTNPLTWDASLPNADRESNPGAVLFNFNKIVKHVAGANVHSGVLWTDKPHFFGSILYAEKNYHIADYNFYYISVRNNVQQRLKAYLAANPPSVPARAGLKGDK
jgi:hypothetical protein